MKDILELKHAYSFPSQIYREDHKQGQYLQRFHENRLQVFFHHSHWGGRDKGCTTLSLFQYRLLSLVV